MAERGDSNLGSMRAALVGPGWFAIEEMLTVVQVGIQARPSRNANSLKDRLHALAFGPRR
jgi:hypothetical protein